MQPGAKKVSSTNFSYHALARVILTSLPPPPPPPKKKKKKKIDKQDYYSSFHTMVILNSPKTSLALWARRTELTNMGAVVRRPISANPGLNLNLGFFSFCSKAFSRIIFSILSKASSHQIVGKKNNFKLNLLFKLSYLNSNFALTLGYLNPALNNPALIANFSNPGMLDKTFFAC